jgi:nucleotide-binding universal stress UspA family protein
MFKIAGPILAAVALDDGSDYVLREADAFARFYKVELHICHVLPELYTVRPLFPQLHLDDALNQAELEASVRAALLKRFQKLRPVGRRRVDVIIELGTAHAGILRAAEKIGAGLIVAGGKADPEGPAILGGTAEHVTRYAACPVLVARPSPGGKILAATDFSDPALPAIEAAASEARRRKTDLAIIHVMEPLPPVLFSGEGMVMDALPIDVAEQLAAASQERLDKIVRRFKARDGGLLRQGLAAHEILNAASRLPAQLLVVGTHGRTGLTRFALGSVAEGVVRSATCSTLVVRLG